MFGHDLSAPRAVALGQPVSKAAYDYWNALRNGRRLPRRSEIEPARLRSILPHVMLLEETRPGEIVFRLAGTSVCLAFGRELRDHSLPSLWETADRRIVSGALADSLSRAAPLLLRVRAHALGRQPRPGEMMILPLLDESGRPTRLLGSFGFTRDPLGAKAFTRLELLETESILPSRDRVELTAPAAPAPRAALRLVPTARPAPPAPSSMTRPWAGLLRDFLRCEEG